MDCLVLIKVADSLRPSSTHADSKDAYVYIFIVFLKLFIYFYVLKQAPRFPLI